MNIRNILMMVLLSLMSGTTIKAQFNTVGRLYNHPANKTKNPQEINPSLVDSLIFHNGLDLHARSSRVFAMLAGEVVKVGQNRVSGKYVTLKHGSFTVSYCHLSRTFAYQGQTVKAGDTVGITGSTGRSTGEHLHITLKKNGEYIDPQFLLDYITSIRWSCVQKTEQTVTAKTAMLLQF